MVRLFLIIAALIAPALASPAIAKEHGDKRTKPVDTIILHSIGGPTCKDGKPYFVPVKGNAEFWRGQLAKDPVNGAHYVIDRAGIALALIPEDEVANHARGHNPSSIGIELVNTGDGVDPYPEAQVAALIALLKDIRARYGLADAQVTTHQAVDTGKPLECGIARRVDPGPALDLQRVISESRP